jgi:hypothetical protein
MIGVQAPISEQFLYVSVRKREAQIPSDGEEDHLRFELPPLEQTANRPAYQVNPPKLQHYPLDCQ